MPESKMENRRWKKEFDDAVMRQHLIGAWVAVILDPLWFVSDYFIIPAYWKIFFVVRILVTGITLGGILLRKKLNLSPVTIVFIPFLGIALQNAYMYSVMDVVTLYKHTFAYIALFIGAGMFVIWKPVYSIVMVSVTLIGNIILFRIFSHLSCILH